MNSIYDIDLETIIKGHFKILMDTYNLEYKSWFYPILENEFCELHFVKFDHFTLRFHFCEKNCEFNYEVDIFADILNDSGYYNSIELSFSENAGLSDRIDTIINSLAKQSSKYLDKPLRGEFAWKNTYFLRQKQLEPLLDFVFQKKEGRVARRLLREKNPNWEKRAIDDMKSNG